MSTSILPCAGVFRARITIVTGFLVCNPVTIVIQSVTDLRGRAFCAALRETFVGAKTNPGTGSHVICYLAGCGKC